MDIIDHERYGMTLQLKQLARQRMTARIVMLVYVSGLLLFWVCYSLHFEVMEFEYPRLAVLAGVLFLTTGSFYKPRILMLFLSVAVLAYICFDARSIIWLIRYSYQYDWIDLTVNLSIWLVRLVVAVFMIKGTIAEWKWQRLKKEMV